MAIAVRDVCSVFKLRIAVAIAASALAGVAVIQLGLLLVGATADGWLAAAP